MNCQLPILMSSMREHADISGGGPSQQLSVRRFVITVQIFIQVVMKFRMTFFVLLNRQCDIREYADISSCIDGGTVSR